MNKLNVLSSLTLSALFLISSCAQIHKTPSRELSQLMKSSQDHEDILVEPKSGEYTHEMAEADADDNSIKTEVGAVEIDQELPDSESDAVPYSRNFLGKKNTKRMQFWVDYFTKKNRDRFQRFINNGEEYRHHIEAILKEHGLPIELYYVGLIESGYYLGARSHASAVGPWQFIKGTGTRYGLKITSEIDERQDLFKASRAAAMYFKDLHNIFSSWELALSAYNAGENGIIRRIMKHGTRDFYQLSRNKQLPSETINYVPKVLAAMHVIQNAKKYGFHIPKKSNKFFDLTELRPIEKNVSLVSVARRLNVDLEVLKKMNPEIKTNATPKYFAGTYYLRVPQSKYSYKLNDITPEAISVSKPESRKELTRRIATVPAVAPAPTTHRVTRGETLISISRKYKVTPRQIAEANNFSTWRTKVRIGQVLKLSGSRSVSSAPAVQLVKKPIIYQVKSGDNLTTIAKVFGQDVRKIKTANQLKRGKILIGQQLVLPDTQKGIYTVKRGDHLTKVSKEFNLPIEALVKLNSLERNSIYPGQKIIVNID